jgi:hypothetical protein
MRRTARPILVLPVVHLLPIERGSRTDESWNALDRLGAWLRSGDPTFWGSRSSS